MTILGIQFHLGFGQQGHVFGVDAHIGAHERREHEMRST